MKKLIYIVFLILCMTYVFAQPVENVHEELTKNEIYSKIDLEHKGTRKYFSDEMTRQRELLFTEADKRATYYEKEGKSMLNTTYWKLGFAWGGVVFFIVGFMQVLRLKTERTRFNKLQKHLSQAVISDLHTFLNVDKLKEGNIEYKLKPDMPVITDKVQEIMEARVEEINNRKLEKHYKDIEKKKPTGGLSIGEDIEI